MADNEDQLPPKARCPECENVIPMPDIRLMLSVAETRAAARAAREGRDREPTAGPGYYRFYVPAAAIEWLRSGERGISSEAMFEYLTGIPIGRGRKDTPTDPDDLRRCRLLLNKVPEFALRLSEMGFVSERWAKLVKVWDRLGAIMDEETAVSNRCPRTWAAMSRLLFGAAPHHLKHLPDELAEATNG